VWIAGPGLRHAEREVQALHARHGGRLLTGAAAAVDQAMSAVDGADTVHIAAHGRFREDQPLFSALRLADGPLFGHDVPRLARAPRRIVLSACDSGLSAVRPGDEVMGIAAALLGRGTSTVIASVLPVPDSRTVGLVTALHAGLAAGSDPAAALADAAAEHGHLGFVCLGSG
jgi:CHAT domain-containing protein